jgi:hypothetical protein
VTHVDGRLERLALHNGRHEAASKSIPFLHRAKKTSSKQCEGEKEENMSAGPVRQKKKKKARKVWRKGAAKKEKKKKRKKEDWDFRRRVRRR